jgi:hypothetical protein
LREQSRTADASAFPVTTSPVAMSDAMPSGNHPPVREEPVARIDGTPSTTENAASVKSGDASNAEAEFGAAKLEPARLEVEPATAERAEMAVSDDKAADAKSSQATSAETKSADTKSADVESGKTVKNPDQAAKPIDSAKPDITTSVPDQKKDQGRLLGTEKTPAVKPDAAAQAAPKRSGPIAVFVSRKDAKLYVRQNFAPLFDVPVTIAPSDRPLGTHVFTAEVDKNDANVLHWSVVSLPAPTRNAERRDEDERVSRRRKVAGAVEMKAPAPVPDSPAEALDRLTIPADARARIAEALSTGSSIIVSDQGIAGGETGEGTDFIVSLR